MNIEKFARWMPICFVGQERNLQIEWYDLSDLVFTEPFFNQSVRRYLLKNPNCPKLRTSIEEIVTMHEEKIGLEPTGFIFHMSRCGSSLISRFLAANPQNLVISEPGIINEVLADTRLNLSKVLFEDSAWNPLVKAFQSFDNQRNIGGSDAIQVKNSFFGFSEEEKIKLLKVFINKLGQKSGRNLEVKYFVKFTSFNILYLPLIKKVFPHTKWFFVYRHPGEVMVSLLNNPSGWMYLKRLPTLAEKLVNISADKIEQMSDEEYCIKVLNSFCSTALQMNDRNSLVLNYIQLPDAIFSSIVDFFQISLSLKEKENMQDMLKIYSKDIANQRLYIADSTVKQKAASEFLQQMISISLMDSYNKLELVRLEQTK